MPLEWPASASLSEQKAADGSWGWSDTRRAGRDFELVNVAGSANSQAWPVGSPSV